MGVTDFLTFFLSIFFLVQGAMRGFMNSFLVPFSIIVATFLSIVYYEATKDMIFCLILGLVGPFAFYFLLKYLLKKLAKATNTEIKPGFLSRLAGALLTLAWGWVFIFLTLILLAVLPPWGNALTSIHDDVLKSASYGMVKPWGESLFATTEQDPDATASTSPTDDAESLAEDPRFQEVLQDPEVQAAIDSHDMVKLMSNPKMMDLTRQIMSDPETLKKIMAIYSKEPHPHGYFDTPSPTN